MAPDDRRLAILDGALAAALAGLFVLEMALVGPPVPDDGPVEAGRQLTGAATTLLLIASLAVRRRLPLLPLVAALLAAVAAVTGPLDGSAVLLVATAIATYSAGAHAEGRAAVAAVGGIVALVAVTLLQPADAPESPSDVAAVAFVLAGPWLAGVAIRERRGREALLEHRAAQLARDRAAGEAAAVVEERTRIARELHDVVAHAISVIVLQARGARHALASDPAAARSALDTIDAVGTEALTEMRRLVGIARVAGEEATLDPRPGLAGLDALAGQLRGAGLDVDIERTGEPHDLPPGLDLAAYRIVQEALTNALAHAGPGPVRVTVRHGFGTLGLEIVDRGMSVAGPVREGHGLTGMRERVQLYGGSMESGPLADGGFQVRVVLPLGLGGGAAG